MRPVDPTTTVRVHVTLLDIPFRDRERWSRWTSAASGCWLELSRLGSMRAVAEETGVTTSTVSQQIAALAREAGTPLVEPVGRRVRLTPAGQPAGRTTPIADPGRRRRGPPGPRPGRRAGRARRGGRVRLGDPPLAAAGGAPTSRAATPASQVLIHEYEPIEALDLLARDDVDLALVYDYNLAPAVAAGRRGRDAAVGGGVGPGRPGRRGGRAGDRPTWRRTPTGPGS